MTSTESTSKIDEGLYSRQLYAIGAQAQERISKSSVLLCGCSGLGVEIAKNVVLAGVRSFTIQDDESLSLLDLGTRFWADETQVGTNRAATLQSALAELNPYVQVERAGVQLAEIDEEFLKSFTSVVVVNAPVEQQKRINEMCRELGIPFQASQVRGVFWEHFNDFGPRFGVYDTDGREPVQCVISKITVGRGSSGDGGEGSSSASSNVDVEGMILCHLQEEHRHGFEDGAIVKLQELRGNLASLLSGEFVVKDISPETFGLVMPADQSVSLAKVQDALGSKGYHLGALAVEVKKSVELTFRSLQESIGNPTFFESDIMKCCDWMVQHLAFQAVDTFVVNHGRPPAPWNGKDAEEIVEETSALYRIHGELSEDMANQVRLLSYTWVGDLQPVVAFAGGVVGQEVIKSVTGKFTPIRQHCYIDFRDVTPPTESMLGTFALKGDRMDSLRICIGDLLADALACARIFVVGAGAIGCELLKNFALMGVGSGPGGVIRVTDNDMIELSNLNRQFLFRPKDIAAPKSERAAAAAMTMNPRVRIMADTLKVCPDSEDVYTDGFWRDQTALINALDNVEARRYVDRRCVENCRPLIDSGTLGTRGHVQVVVPHLTESYGSQSDPPEQEVPFCTLRSFPSDINHCIQWARDRFESTFKNKPAELQRYMRDPMCYVQEMRATSAEGAANSRFVSKLLSRVPTSFSDCVRRARLEFESLFNHSIQHLLHVFPPDHLEEGKPFWKLPRRLPHPLTFDAEDPEHVEFVVQYAQLLAAVFSVEVPEDTGELLGLTRQVAAAVEPEPFVFRKKAVETDTSIKEKKKEPSVDGNRLMEILNELEERAVSLPSGCADKVVPQDFEKDDDSNHHVAFVAACANLRARCYTIPEASNSEVKRIAGKIIPALATTTSAVSGLVCVEFLKLVHHQSHVPRVEDFKNYFLNLAVPCIYFSDPYACPQIEVNAKLSLTMWDKLVVDVGDMTIREFVQYFEDTYGLAVKSITEAGKYRVFMKAHPKARDQLKKRMSQVLKTNAEVGYAFLDVVCRNIATGEDVAALPQVIFHLPPPS